MGDEEDAARLGADRVEGGEPGLAQTGRQHDKPGAVAVRSALRERFQCLLLDRMRLWWRAFLGHHAGGELGHRSRSAAFGIGIDPRGRQGLHLGRASRSSKAAPTLSAASSECRFHSTPSVSADWDRFELPTIAAPRASAARNSQALG